MTVDEGPSRTQLLLSRLAAVLVVAGGVALFVLGLQRTDAFGGAQALVGRLPRVSQPVVVTAPGMTELSGATVRVRAASTAVSVPVFIGVGRADDVEAYLGDAARAEVTALEEDASLRVVARQGAAALPDPSGVDVWASSVRAAGVATLTWPRTPGPWRLVIATDGRTPPTAAEFTWSGHAGVSPAPALIAVGAVLVVVGIAALLAMRSGRLLTARLGAWPGGAGRAAGRTAATARVRGSDADRPTRGRRAAPEAAAASSSGASGASSSEVAPDRPARRAGRHSAPVEPASPRRRPAEAEPAEGVPAEGVPAKGVPAKGVPAKGVQAEVGLEVATPAAGSDAIEAGVHDHDGFHDHGGGVGDEDDDSPAPAVLPFRRGSSAASGGDA